MILCCVNNKTAQMGLIPLSLAVNLCSNADDRLQIYRENFEKAYLDSTERFYKTQAPSYLQQNGVQNYMKYVSASRKRQRYFIHFHHSHSVRKLSGKSQHIFEASCFAELVSCFKLVRLIDRQMAS